MGWILLAYYADWFLIVLDRSFKYTGPGMGQPWWVFTQQNRHPGDLLRRHSPSKRPCPWNWSPWGCRHLACQSFPYTPGGHFASSTMVCLLSIAAIVILWFFDVQYYLRIISTVLLGRLFQKRGKVTDPTVIYGKVLYYDHYYVKTEVFCAAKNFHISHLFFSNHCYFQQTIMFPVNVLIHLYDR